MVEPDISLTLEYELDGTIAALILTAPPDSTEARFCKALCDGLEQQRAYPKLIPEGLFFYNAAFRELPSIGVWVNDENRRKIIEFFREKHRFLFVSFDNSFMMVTLERGFLLQHPLAEG